MTTIYVSSGITSTGLTVPDGTTVEILNGGSAVSTIIGFLGLDITFSGGTEIGTTVDIFGDDYISSGGVAISTTLNEAGTQYILQGGSAVSTIVNSGVQHIASGGVAIETTINNAGYQVISSGGSATQTTVNSGGTEYIIAGGAATSVDMTLGGMIDLGNLAYAAGATAVIDPSSDVLTVSAGGSSTNVDLSGGYTGQSFVVASDSGSGTLLTLVADPVITEAISVTADAGQTVAIATAAPANSSDPLQVTLISDSDFATGSTLAISGGTLLYTPGTFTTASQANDTLTYQVTDTVTSATTSATQTISLTPTTITGAVYTWNTHALLSGVTIVATSGSSVVSAVTNALGVYSLTVTQGSTYTITESLAAPTTPQGVTSLEALDALKQSVGINPNALNSSTATKAAISPYEDMAADVLGKGTVTSLDALDILKMSVGLASAPAQKWEFVSTNINFWNSATGGYSTTAQSTPTTASTALTITATALVTNADFAAVLTGNVNGSYAPPSSATESTAAIVADALAAGDPADQFGIASYTVSSVLAANSLTAKVDVVDSAANVVASLDQLQAIQSNIAGIWLNDSTAPTVTFTALQASNDAGVLGQIIGDANIVITASAGTTNLSIAELGGSVSVTMAGNSGAASLAGSSLSFITPPGVLTLGSGADTVNFSLAAASGVQEINNFTLGTDVLNITLNGNTLAATEVTLAAGSGTFIYSTSDSAHGVLLLGVNLPSTGAGSFSSHVTYTNGGTVATLT